MNEGHAFKQNELFNIPVHRYFYPLIGQILLVINNYYYIMCMP